MDDKKARVLLLDPKTGQVIGEADIITDSSTVLYTNKKETVGDFRGIESSTTFNETPVSDILDKLLYPDIEPQVEWVSMTNDYSGLKDQRSKPLNDHTIYYFIEVGTVIPSFILSAYIANRSAEILNVSLNIYKENSTTQTLSVSSGKLPPDSHYIAEFEVPEITDTTTLELVISDGKCVVNPDKYCFEFITPIYNGFITPDILNEEKADLNGDSDFVKTTLQRVISSDNTKKYIIDKSDICQFVRTGLNVITREKLCPYLLVPRSWGSSAIIQCADNIINSAFLIVDVDIVIGSRKYPYILFIMINPAFNNDTVLETIKYKFNLSDEDRHTASILNNNKNTPILTSFAVHNNLPIDDRFTVDTYADLLCINYTYEGLLVYVKDIRTFFKFEKNSWKPACNTVHLIELGSELIDDFGGWDDIAINVISGEIFKKSYNNKWEKWGVIPRTDSNNTSVETPQLRFRREWDVLSTYVKNDNYIDIVVYNGTAYYCKVINCSVAPDTNDSYWGIFAGK